MTVLPCITTTMGALAMTELLLLMAVGLLCFDLHNSLVPFTTRYHYVVESVVSSIVHITMLLQNKYAIVL